MIRMIVDNDDERIDVSVMISDDKMIMKIFEKDDNDDIVKW